MKSKTSEILPLIKTAVESMDYMFIDLNLRGSMQIPVVEIFVDSNVGINSDDCAKISQTISEVFDKLNVLGDKYRLDVSSPGLDRPLKFLEQFPKHLNRKFEVKYSDGELKNKINAKLVGVENQNLIFETQNGNITVPFENINSAKVLISL